MRYRFQFRRYRLPFRSAVRTAHGLWPEREGVLVQLRDASEGAAEAAGLGEAAPIPWFGTESVDEVEAVCREMGEWVETDRLDAVPARLGCLRHAIASAQADLRRTAVSPETGARENTSAGEAGTLGIAALLPAGRAALALIEPKAEIGFRVFKWKVGVGDIADELALLDDLCARLPSGGKLRLDANGAWDRRRAERCLERCADRPVEFLEQPSFAQASEGAARQRKTEEMLLGLAGDYPTPIALDESLVGEGDIERWIGAGWPGVFVVKPLLLAVPAAALARLAKARARVVFSSALETAVGARTALRLAFDWTRQGGERLALGFGVWPLFVDSRFDGPAGGAFIRADDVPRINAEAAWTALS